MNKNIQFNYNLIIPIILFTISFYYLPLNQLSNFNNIPGSEGDALLNNYFLENIYLFFKGKSASLWHLDFYYPFPYILGFSDNLFGASPLYLVARVLSEDPQTAYQIWFLAAYPLNFIAAFYVFKKLGIQTIGATAGALFFTFGLPTSSHVNHLQLHYRFALLFSITYLFEFLNHKEIKFINLSFFWLTWQFYCGIYMGFFTLCILLSILFSYIFNSVIIDKNFKIIFLKPFITKTLKLKKSILFIYLLILIITFILLMLLFIPYLKVNNLYQFKRHWMEISMMLPTIESYFIADHSYFWEKSSKLFGENISMRHEHNLFIGLIPFLLFIHGIYLISKNKSKIQNSKLLLSSILIIFLSTLYINNFSIWFYLYKLPLFSAIRAVTRFDQALLFPIAFFVAISIDSISKKKYPKLIAYLIIVLLIIEYCATSFDTHSKVKLNSFFEHQQPSIQSNIKPNSILFFAQTDAQYIPHEVNVMWLSKKLGVPTLNGYSGSMPPDYSYYYDTDCTEIPKRIYAYFNFIGKTNSDSEFLAFINRVVPVGFINCNPNWLTKAPGNTSSHRKYTAEEISKIKYEFIDKIRVADHWVVNIKISNFNNAILSARSSIGNPLRISWRFLDPSQKDQNPWELRKDLPFDLAPNESLILQIPIHKGMEIKGGILQISMVQELVFWAHDIGVEPLSIPWSN